MTDTLGTIDHLEHLDTTAEPKPSALPGEVSAWRRLVARGLVAYLLSRLCVMAGAAVVAAQRVVRDREESIPRPSNAVGKIIDVLTSWDGKWYYAIVRDSYPTRLPTHITWDDYQARTAFFPMFPNLVRWFDWILPGGDVVAGLVLNFVFGAIVVVIVGALAKELFDQHVGYRAMLLMALFPGSFVLSFTYSEATMLLFSAACLLCLVRRNWLLAGTFASFGAATRPNGVALIAACFVAAGFALWERREWRALIAPALAPLGFIAFHVFLWHRTGEAKAWLRTQSEAWGEGTSFGLTAIRNTIDAFVHPLSSPTDVITAISFITTIVLVVAMAKKCLPPPLVAYTAVILILMLAPSTVTARPRFLYTAFPLLISGAAWLSDIERRHDAGPAELSTGHELWTVVLGLSAAGLVTLTGLYGVLGAIP